MTLHTELPWGRILFAPLAVGRRDVERIGNLRYGDAGKQHLLDLYRPRRRNAEGAVLLYFHGGGFRGGSKRREGRMLLTHLASRGWLCISANYRLQPHSRRDALIDVKRVIAWVRAHGHEYGADPASVFLAGGSAGGYLERDGRVHAERSLAAAGLRRRRHVGDRSDTAVRLLRRPRPRRAGNVTAHDRREQCAAVLRRPRQPRHARAPYRRAPATSSSCARSRRSRSSTPSFPAGSTCGTCAHSIRSDAVVNAVEAFTAWVRSRAYPTTSRAARAPRR